MPSVRVPEDAFDALPGQADGRRRSLDVDRVSAVALLCALTALLALAYASPTDPLWLPGIYDNADYDDVVLFLCDAGAVLDTLSVASGESRYVARLARLVVFTPGQAVLLAFHLRSPPGD